MFWEAERFEFRTQRVAAVQSMKQQQQQQQLRCFSSQTSITLELQRGSNLMDGNGEILMFQVKDSKNHPIETTIL